MTATLVDSNVLLDVATDDSTWGRWSADALARCADEGPLVINAVIYAEVSTGYDRIEDLDAVLDVATFERQHAPYEAAFLAGKAFLRYRRRGGTKTGVLPDFFIGAHAALAGLRLLTRDASRYRSYFPTVRLISP